MDYTPQVTSKMQLSITGSEVHRCTAQLCILDNSRAILLRMHHAASIRRQINQITAVWSQFIEINTLGLLLAKCILDFAVL